MRCSNEDCRDAVAALRELEDECRTLNRLNWQMLISGKVLDKVKAVLARIDANSDEEG